MKAILTKYLGPTNSRGSRIKASAEGVPSITVSFDYAERDGGRYLAACQLANKYGWLRDDYQLVEGGLPNGESVFVMVPRS